MWVKAGTYAEKVTLRNLAYVYGGFAGTETERSGRDWSRNVAVLDAGKTGAVVTASGVGYGLGAIDGFTIRNGGTSSGDGIRCYGASPAIANNTITGNAGRGIYCAGLIATIANNTIAGNSGGGIYSFYSGPTIRNNVIVGNNATSSGGGIYCYSSSPTISNNTITGNSASNGGGINCENYSPATITGNTIAG